MAPMNDEPEWIYENVLPVQLSEPSPEASPLRGVRTLMAAVLEDAVRCLLEGSRPKSGAHARIRAGASARWIRSTDTSWPFSFQSICDVLSIDADRLRRELTAKLDEDGEGGFDPRRSLRRVEKNGFKIRLPRRRGKAGVARAA